MGALTLETGKAPSSNTTVEDAPKISQQVEDFLSSVINTKDDPIVVSSEKVILKPVNRQRNRRHRKLTYEQIVMICEGYKAGKDSYELGAQFSVHPATILDCLDKYGIEKRSASEAKRRISIAQRLEICERYRKGEKVAKIAEAFGIGDRIIYVILKAHGVKPRSKRSSHLRTISKKGIRAKSKIKTHVAANLKEKVQIGATKKGKSVRRNIKSARSVGSTKTKRNVHGVRSASLTKVKAKAKANRPANTRVRSKRSKVKISIGKGGRSRR
ncbi:MAG: hypothetical protein AB1489_32755 [Acidobacteriota bacterium]